MVKGITGKDGLTEGEKADILGRNMLRALKRE
jgi:hypothetical protein